jgi:thymidylate kinase
MNLKRIAIVGIDGSGKSTITKRLFEMFSGSGYDAIVMNCPSYHNTPNAPLADLSELLEAFTKIADNLGSFQLKGVSIFLQATLFGPIEKFLIETFQPKLLISERHAIVDAISYGAFYQNLMRQKMDREQLEGPLRDALEKFQNGAYRSLLNWVEHLCKRLGHSISLWEIDRHILEIFSKEGIELVDQLKNHFLTTLPDTVIMLDVKGEKAYSRVTEREDQHKELHEQSEMLEQIRQSYFNVFRFLNENYPGITTHIIETGDQNTIDAVLRQVIEQSKK